MSPGPAWRGGNPFIQLTLLIIFNVPLYQTVEQGWSSCPLPCWAVWAFWRPGISTPPCLCRFWPVRSLARKCGGQIHPHGPAALAQKLHGSAAGPWWHHSAAGAKQKKPRPDSGRGILRARRASTVYFTSDVVSLAHKRRAAYRHRCAPDAVHHDHGSFCTCAARKCHHGIKTARAGCQDRPRPQKVLPAHGYPGTQQASQQNDAGREQHHGPCFAHGIQHAGLYILPTITPTQPYTRNRTQCAMSGAVMEPQLL